jgi:RNA polymerase sigma-70 factor (ECF subfamily)
MSVEVVRNELRTRWGVELDALPDLAETIALASQALVGPHRDDLILAWACLAGAPAAISALERNVLGAAAAHVRRSGLPGDIVDEAVQLTRIRLIMASDDRTAQLGQYRGRGPLAGFVRTIVLRTAIDLVRRDRGPPEDHIAAILDHPVIDPELEYMRAHYGEALRDALAAAWSAIAPHERFVLGLVVQEKLDLAAVAAVYQVHRATAARKAASARAALLAGAREHIRSKLAVGDATIDSILRVVTTSKLWDALAEVH